MKLAAVCPLLSWWTEAAALFFQQYQPFFFAWTTRQLCGRQVSSHKGSLATWGEDHQIPFEHEEHHEGPHRVVLCHEFGSSCCHHIRDWGLRLASWDPSPPLKLTCTFGENSRQRCSEVWRNPHHSGHGSDCVGLWFSPQRCQPHVVCHPSLPKRAIPVWRCRRVLLSGAFTQTNKGQAAEPRHTFAACQELLALRD